MDENKLSDSELNEDAFHQNHIDKKKHETSNFLKIILLSWGLIKVRGLLFNKFFSNYLNLNEFGRFNFLFQTAVFIGNLGTLGLSNAIIRFTSEYREQGMKKRVSNLIFTVTLCSTGMFILLIGVNIILINLDLTSFEDINAIVLVLIGFLGFFYLIQVLINSYTLAKRDSFAYFFINVVVVYTNLILAFLFTLVQTVGATDLLLVYVFSHGLFMSIFLVKIFTDNGMGRFSTIELKKVLRFSTPGLILSPLLNFFNYLQYFLLRSYNGDESVSLFIISLSTAGFLSIIVNAISNSFTSLQFSLFDSKEHNYLKSLINKMLRIYIALLIPCILLIWFNAGLLIEILSNSSYVNSETILGVLILGLGFLFRALLHFTCQAPYFYKKTKEIAGLYLAAVIIAGLSSFVLIPTLGIIGVCVAFSLHDFLRWLFVFPYSQSLFKISYSLSKILSIIIPTTIFLVTSWMLSDLLMLPVLITSLIGFSIYIITIYVTGIISIAETKHLLRQIMRK